MCGPVTLDAVFLYARDHLHYPEHCRDEGLEPHKVGDDLMWGTEEPDTFIHITDTVELKIEALMKHTSQVAGSGSGTDVAEFVKSNARRTSQRADLPNAEVFRHIQFRR